MTVNADRQIFQLLQPDQPYDVVLIGPFLRLLAGIKPEFLISLVIYVAVLVYSGGVAVYYLAKKSNRSEP